ncbi:hypothetical protein Pcinc_001761 [Petrolisthes cinctipes]|uniref:CUB domain-containing protein n=1 Tax=Petrolisthes cinctipes TaxID=88211 RepID=A0AAE1GL14_PETCI|nr:hypothetical protein Pcinc_001761 [Petrolisthes cinctipes]
MWESKCSTTSTTCLNEGYTGANCSCVCPPNFSGDNCENQIRESYYAPPTDGCTQRVTTEKNLFAPNMSADVSDELQCAIEIIAPQGMKPRLTFNTFNLQPRATCTEGDCCYYENLQFRENYPESSTATVTSCGWSADLTFVSDPNCIPTDGGCTLEFNEISTYNWKSPGFDGTTEYPICSTCTQDMTGAPEGKQIEIKKLVTKVKANTDCTSNFLLVNGDGDRRYPMDTSTIICDYDTRNNCLTTNTNNLLVAYQKTGLDSKGFKMVIMVT